MRSQRKSPTPFSPSRLARLLVPVIAYGAIWTAASAQTSEQPAGPVFIDPAAVNSPYAVDAGRALVRNSTGLCYRTGYWSLESAASTKVVGSEFPAGCYCDKGLLPRETCEPKPVAVAPAAPAPTPVVPVPMPVPEKVTIPAKALFDFDKSKLSNEGKDTLKALADQLKSLNLESVTATGHTDRIGTEKYNQKLSERRAAAVKAFLIEQGVDSTKVFEEGKGESQPVTGDECKKMGRENASNKKLVKCLEPDRRVEVEAVGVKR